MENTEVSSSSEYDVCYVAKVSRNKELHLRKKFSCPFDKLSDAVRDNVENSHGKCISGTILSIYDESNGEYIITSGGIDI
jgi:hypothetical protein